MIVLSKIQCDRTCNLNCELQEGGEKKRYRLKEEYEYCPHSSVQMWRFKGLWAEQMAFYAIIGRLGLCCCTRPARGVQSSTCAGIIVIVCAQQKSGVFHLKTYMANSPHVYLPLEWDNNPYGLWKSWHGVEITLDIGSAWITPFSAFCQI